MEKRRMARAILMHEKDNVATVLTDVEAGDEVVTEGAASRQIVAGEAIPFGHKIAIASITKDKKILKYGEIIGIATFAIKAGEHVHVHNLKSSRR